MKYFDRIKKYHKIIVVGGILSLLSLLSVIGILSCGKLSDDTNHPSSPIGTSGGQAIPITPQASWGTYSLSLSASPNTIPADGVSYTGLQAKLQDSSGRSMENILVKFQVLTTSDAIAIFKNAGATTGSAAVSTSTTGFTHQGGSVSVNLYGVQSGSAVVQATVDLDLDGAADLTTTTVVILTPSGPPSSAGSYSLSLTATPATIPADKGTCSNITVTLTDRTGGSVEGLAVELKEITAFGSFTAATTTTTTATAATYPGITDKAGKLSACFYGYAPGNALIQATVAVPDLSATLQKTVTVTISAVTIPSPTITFTLGSPTVPCTWATVTTATLDAFVLVRDSTGNRIGGITLGYWFLTQPGCSGVDFADYSGTVTTDTAGRARITTTLTGTGTGTCQYKVEVAYQGTAYTSPITGTIFSCGATAPTPTPAPVTLTLTPNPATVVAPAITSDITITIGGAPLTPIQVNLTTTGGTLSVANPVMVVGSTVVTLTYPLAGRPKAITVFGEVAPNQGYSGSNSTSVTFN